MILLSRRRILQVSPFLGMAISNAHAAQFLPTPACDDGDADITSANEEGPFFKPRSPERTSLLDTGIAGTKLVLSGMVVSGGCKPLANTVLDFWQADDGGTYDNTGFKLRGYQRTDANGKFRLETIVPGLYPGRTRHIHVKAMSPGGVVLTTQIYFPGEARNARDGLFRPDLVMSLAKDSAQQTGHFDFVLKTA